MSSSLSNKVTLESADGKIFTVEESVIKQSTFLKVMIEDNCAHAAIPVQNVTGKILDKVLDYCYKHQHKVDTEEKEEELKAWDKSFIELNQKELVQLLNAAKYLSIKGLLELAGRGVAETLIKGRSVEEIRKAFGIKNDFTPEEEAEYRSKNQWAFN